MAEPAGVEAFADVERVVADALRFKRRLRIGEDAYASKRAVKPLQELWDIGGAAATGAGAAASQTVATTIFAHTASGGLLSWVGLGTAATTPVGWVAAAALISGGAWWGVTRLFRGAGEAMVDTIPRFINTPIDLLGVQLLDLMGPLAVRVATVDGRFDPAEREAIRDHLAEEWGYDRRYAERALDLFAAGSDGVRVHELARALAAFQAANPDCNASAMQAELILLLRDVAAADGVLDEREELAIKAIEEVFREEAAFSLRNAARSVGDWAAAAGRLAGKLRPGGAASGPATA